LLRFGIAFLLTVDLGISLYIQHYEVIAYLNGNDNQYTNYQGPIITQIIWPFLRTGFKMKAEAVGGANRLASSRF